MTRLSGGLRGRVVPRGDPVAAAAAARGRANRARRVAAVARRDDIATEVLEPPTFSGRGASSAEATEEVVREGGVSVPVLDAGTRFHVRAPRDLGEMYQVAMLRAECYYEDRPFSRYVDNFKVEYAR